MPNRKISHVAGAYRARDSSRRVLVNALLSQILLQGASSFFSFHITTTGNISGQPSVSMDFPEPSKYITLVSGDGFEFVVLRKAALVSPIIKGMLDVRSQFAEAQDARCVFQEMR